ncbi:MAG: hypothetical protein A3H70_00085 [Candidatus Komeilibacteria bacterium RIFCSPLOWO2_02_FULL_48_11]|uniref:Uncharacterized protein n=1 Tax=Candidatus Komeilibacteria bacterium RIFCSPLOWO2_02_FULL_48_11 TaxID=1798553 RepID=A0A1G2BSP8_9BACT|nr:MAG: hypothetical protein A3H70_00085 [Candidatus Komeilibacteria bacterium RIFCSPLOWO2_02_FULL_48_11]
MTTQVIFTIDKKLKERVMKKARQEGVPFASIFEFAANAYVCGQFNVDLAGQEVFNDKTRRELIEISKDIKEGKNLSPRFKTIQEIKDYLNK